MGAARLLAQGLEAKPTLNEAEPVSKEELRLRWCRQRPLSELHGPFII